MSTAYDDERLQAFKKMLLERKRSLWDDVAASLRDELGEEYQQQFGRALDDPERALVDLLGDTDMAVIENRRDELTAIEEALNRIDQGTYGLCSDCGEPIPPRRLEVQPFAVRCVEDQARAEGRAARPTL